MLWVLAFLVSCHFSQVKTNDNSSLNIVLKTTENPDLVCSTVKCISKCCPINEIVEYGEENVQCKPYKGNEIDWDLNVYKDNKLDVTWGKLRSDVFKLLPNKFDEIDNVTGYTFAEHSYTISLTGLRYYLSQDGILYIDFPNAYKRWMEIKTEKFCIDYLNDSDTLTYDFWRLDEVEEESDDTFYVCTMAISSFFLFLVLIVYAVLPELRNICGKVRMAYVASHMSALILLVVIRKADPSKNGCIGLTGAIYFFYLASFSWVNVMSCDIWWTFRGMLKSRPIHRRGENFKFCMYCIYAFGVPLVMTIGLLVINSIDLSDSPDFVKPLVPEKGCFLIGGQIFLYLYIPMLIQIGCNWIFFLMTAYNVWGVNRDTAVLRSANSGTPQAHRNHKQRLMVYVRLSVIMGVNWLLDVVSSFDPKFLIWKFTDAYNLLLGVAIFAIFVCNKKTLNLLRQRFPVLDIELPSICGGEREPKTFSPRTESSSTSSSCTLDSNSANKTQLKVITHPAGTDEKWGKTSALSETALIQK